MTQNQQATPQTEAGIVMISFDVSLFGGYKRTSEQDIVEAGGALPDTEILTKGGKHIFPSDKLAPFGTNKKAVQRQLSEFGVKALGGGSVIAIHENDLQEAERILEDGNTEHQRLLAELDLNYDLWLDDFIQDNSKGGKKGGDIIRRSALTREDAINRFSYSYDTFKPTPCGKNGSVESMAQKLTNQLYTEIAQAAFVTWNVTFNPVIKDSGGQRARRKVGQKALSPFRGCRDKLNKLAFLNPSVKGAVQIIESVLCTMPSTGYIEDTPSNPADARLYALVGLMMDAIKFANAAEAVVSGADADGVLNYNRNVVQAELVAEVLQNANAIIQVDPENVEDVPVAPVVSVSTPASIEVDETNDEALFF